MKNSKKTERDSSQDSSDLNPEQASKKIVKKRLRNYNRKGDDRKKEEEENKAQKQPGLHSPLGPATRKLQKNSEKSNEKVTAQEKGKISS